MTSRTSAAVAIVAVAGLVVFGVVGWGVWQPEHPPPPGDVTSGEQAAGVVLVHQASFEGTLTERAFRSAFEAADGPDEKAAVAGRYLDRGHERLVELRERMTTLERARENGSLSAGAFQARAGRVREASGSLRSLSSSIESAVASLPEDVRRRHDVTAARVTELGREAAALRESIETPQVSPAFDAAFYADFQDMVGRYNAEVRSAGDGSPDLLADESVNLVVEDGQTRTVLSFEVAGDGTIEDVRAGTGEDATVRLRTDRDTMAEINDADDPATALRRAIERESVEIEGIGLKNGIKWAILRELARLG